MQIARPLFSASFGVSLFFVALVTASGAIARLIAAPLAGLLSDRVGRRPMVISGLAVRSISGVLSFWATSYEQFLLLEFLGSVGLAVWNTGVNVIIADVTAEENRGRAVALRTISQRLGTLCGPFVGGVLAANFGLRSIFLLNGGGKFVALLIFLVLVRETRPGTRTGRQPAPESSPEPQDTRLALFLTRPFIIVVLATLAVYMLTAGGAFEVLFPLHATASAGLDTVGIGQMLTVFGVASLAASFPTGWILDRFGRKSAVVPGLLLMGLSAYLLAGAQDYWAVFLAVALTGFADGMTVSATQVLAMDLAPRARRGVFMGFWMLVSNAGGGVAPLVLGGVADKWGFPAAFTSVAVCLAVVAVVVALFGPETRARRDLAP